ncbi:MAG: nucleoside triphosphate pyrophosphohydrolase [Thermoanaerobaculia bacterium]|nr:nucleoside triphosphate pyrophosphohydrolase [Thermoanaerobaculia bacterium]
MPTPTLESLVALVERLRAPDGCPWDRDQTLADVRAYLLEEAHEVAGAIDGGDLDAIAAELGDLLFQVTFVASLVGEQGGATLDRIIERIHDKMVERHPHVFGDEKLADTAAVNRAWETRKARQAAPGESLLAGVPDSLPALLTGYRLSQKAAGVGFDWPGVGGVLDKIEEEIEELRQQLEATDAAPRDDLAEELGDLLFALANLGRHLGIDPEGALARTNRKFRRRFRFIEESLATEGRRLEEADLEEMEHLWNAAKELSAASDD